MSWSIKIIRDDLTPMLAQARQNMPKTVTDKMGEVVDQMLAMAKSIVPVRTGKLRASIYSAIYAYFQFEVGANAPYAVFVEFGTSKMRAQPFIRPSVARYEKDLMKAIADGVIESLGG